VGFEISLLRYLLGWVKIRLLGLNGRIQLKYRNFFHADVSQADIIYVFLMPEALKKLKMKLDKEAKPGGRILSYAFPIEGWEPKTIDKPEKTKTAVYLYQR
jgi:hypothetical protein